MKLPASSVRRPSAPSAARDIGVAHKLARKIKAGMVRINGASGLDANMPMGGYDSRLHYAWRAASLAGE